MRVIELSSLLTFLLDVFAWLIIHFGVSYLCLKLPSPWFERKEPIFQGYGFEQGGRIYERILRIKSWKSYLPDGGGWFREGFAKKSLAEATLDYLQRFMTETRRAELTHWLCFAASLFFFLWNDAVTGVVMVVYASIANLPCIFAQRYNRFRFLRLYRKKVERSTIKIDSRI